ncbi:MAG: ATP-binding protein [Edaphobacter sp.]|uniref:sensor histidine kinase n=1 Tax=Edaphobacter sp. TaxID=1934404 RepID=UPI0023926548|nr:ATP-binding protein [Edaphobacter sp.]MDE1176604.1 ATP-binding protein [Edaphobacter sp.]
MAAADLVERLARHTTVGAAPEEELRWLAEHGELRQLEVGVPLSHKGQPVEWMYLILTGRMALFVDRGSGPNRMVEWHAGDVGGLLPYSRIATAPGNSMALEPTEVLALHRDQIREMTHACFELTTLLVHRLVDRARLFTSTELQNEKMISLGKLSAGLAHELNNPASAIERSVSLLTDRLEEAEDATLELGLARLSEQQLTEIEKVRSCCLGKKAKLRPPMEQLDREEEIADWLAVHGLNTLSAHTLADTEVTIDELNAVAQVVQGAALSAALRWAASGCAVRGLASEIRGASMRISSLIMAVKGFTHMDQAMVADNLDLEAGLRNAVMVLQAKTREKSVFVSMEMEAGLPQVMGYGAELNQVWGNLIDNALDAAPEGGCVEVRAAREGDHVVVRIGDNGAGIPPEIQSSIFDPFFTTKPQGHGTGLGLDIARRLVGHNDGVIEFDSIPGRTEFRVSLPVARHGHA